MVRPENPEAGMSPGNALLPEVPPELARRRLSLRTILLFFAAHLAEFNPKLFISSGLPGFSGPT